MKAIFRKELWSYFGNWSAWLIIAGFSVIGALFLFFFENSFNIFETGAASLQGFFVLAPWLYLFIIPALSMRSVAEEQQNGTLLWLFSQPLKTGEIISGKFFAVWLVAILCLVPSLLYFYTVYTLGVPPGNLDGGMTMGGYFGLLLLSGAFSAIGILASALSSNQIVAYLLGVFMSFLFYFGIQQLASYKLLGGADYVLQNLGFYHHFLAFTRGIIDFKDVSYFLLVIILSLFASAQLLDKKK